MLLETNAALMPSCVPVSPVVTNAVTTVATQLIWFIVFAASLTSGCLERFDRVSGKEIFGKSTVEEFACLLIYVIG